MFKKSKRAFTLVELIIVIAIIAILAVTAFLLLTKWLAESRDTRRLSDLNTIENALNIYMADGTNTTYPTPTDVQTYSYADGGSTGTILYQGNIGDDLKTAISLQGQTVDPSDSNLKYVYAINAAKTSYALMAYMEGDKYNTTSSLTFSSPDGTVGNKFPKVIGKQIGVLINGSTKAALSSGVVFTSGSTTTDGLALIDVSSSSSLRYVGGANLIALKGPASSAYGLVAYYPFIAFDLAKDRSGMGAADLGATVTVGSGYFGSGVNSAPTLASLAALTKTSNSTISLWIYGAPTGAGNIISGDNFMLSGSSTALSYNFSGVVGTVSSLNLGSSWTNIAITYSASDKTAIIYVNGDAKKSVASVDGPSGASTITFNSTPLLMDEIRFYNRAFGSDDVKKFYKNY